MRATIYVLVNLINGKSYIGVAADITVRLGQHARGRSDGEQRICQAIRKHGWDNFAVAVIDRSDDYRHAVNMLEPLYISKYGTTNRDVGYNVTEGGEGAKGYRHTAESRAKMSALAKGRKRSDETKAAIRAAQLGRTHTEETKAKIRVGHLGRKRGPLSEEWRARLSAVGKGRKLSPRAIESLRVTKRGHKYNVGRHHTPEARAKISAGNKGKTVSPETRELLSLAAKRREPRNHSVETREKMKLAAVARWSRQREAGVDI